MLNISTDIFCEIFSIRKGGSNSSISSLIDSLSEDESEHVHGKLIAKFGRQTKQYLNAKESIYGYISFIEGCFRKLESNIFFLTFHYAGIDWNNPAAVKWWWTDHHSLIFKSIIDSSNDFNQKNFIFFELITIFADEKYKNRIQSLLNSCTENIILNNDIDIGSDVLSFYLNLSKIHDNDDFLNCIFSKILFINNSSSLIKSFELVFPHVKNLMLAIINKDRLSIQNILKQLNLENIPSKLTEISTHVFQTSSHDWIDPSWWREQE
jgi:hypothetical protein